VSFVKNSGTPTTAYLSLTNATPGPAPFALKQISGGALYTLAPNEVFVIELITISSNDPTQALVTVDDGPNAPGFITRRLASQYVSASVPTTFPNFQPGFVSRRGIAPRGTAGTVSAGKTIELVATGYITSTT